MRLNTRIAIAGLATAALATALMTPMGGDPAQAQAASETLLFGVVTETDGTPMPGVTVSAQRVGSPTVVSVFSDESGRYYFPPLQEPGQFKIAAQAPGYARNLLSNALVSGINRAEFRMSSSSKFDTQLSGWQQAAGLPEDTKESRRGKAMLLKMCSACHETSKIFTRRFDEKGWANLIEAMPYMVGRDETSGPEAFKTHRKELATYLAKVSGPTQFSMKLADSYRPTGDALRAVVYSYAISNVDGGYAFNAGNDWALGNPLLAGSGIAIHDATVDGRGDVWFTVPVRTEGRTVGRMNGVTGALRSYALPGDKGATSMSHGMITAADGKIVFTQAHGSSLFVEQLATIDPASSEVATYPLPSNSTPVSGWLNADAKNGIWAATASIDGREGVWHLDPKTGKYTQYKSTRNGMTYGVAGDRDGNGWWAMINQDSVQYVDRATGKVGEVLIPFTWSGAPFLRPGDMSRDEYLTIIPGLGASGHGNANMPRRIRADHSADALWVANYSSDSILRIDTKTKETKSFQLPFVGSAPYDVAIDSRHRVWVALQNGDEIARLDPEIGRWTIYPLPVKGIAARSIFVLERGGQIEVVVPANDAGQVVKLLPQTAESYSQRIARYQ